MTAKTDNLLPVTGERMPADADEVNSLLRGVEIIEGVKFEKNGDDIAAIELSTLQGNGDRFTLRVSGRFKTRALLFEIVRPRGCRADCGHSRGEHVAFDEGVRAGEEGLTDDACSYGGKLRDAWLTGHSVTYRHKGEE
jgi:hypothetical protein